MKWLLLLLVAGAAPAFAGEPVWRDARQMVLVVPRDWDDSRAVLTTWTRDGDAWKPAAAAVPASIGRTGSAWGLGLHPAQAGVQKREGDGKSPAGVFEIGPAFGSAPTLATALDYLPMSATHWCMDVVDSPLYNRIVDAKDVGDAAVQGSSERMRLDLATAGDARYSQGFVIRHNPDNVAGAGSCIFGHLWKAPDAATAGCTAMTAEAMSALLAWLDASAHPVLVLLPRDEYEKLRDTWALPDLSLANPHF